MESFITKGLKNVNVTEDTWRNFINQNISNNMEFVEGVLCQSNSIDRDTADKLIGEMILITKTEWESNPSTN